MTTDKMTKTLDYKPDNYELGELGEYFVDYSGHHYICDVIAEIADNNVDIYTYDLFEWAKRNYHWVEEAIAQGLCDMSNPDIPRMLMAGQYEQNTCDLYDHLDASILNYCLNYIAYDLKQEFINDEQFEKLQDKCTDVDNNDTLDIFEDFCTELFESQEDDEKETRFCPYTNDTIYCNGICNQCHGSKKEQE